MGITIFHIVTFVVECLVVIIGLIEIEVRFHPIRRLLNWKASRSRLTAQRRINKLTDELAKLQLKLTEAQKYTVVEMLNWGLRGVFLVLVCITGSLFTESPLLQVTTSPRIPSPNVLVRLFNFWQRFVEFPFKHNLVVWTFHFYSVMFLLFAGIICFIAITRLVDRSVSMIGRKIRDIEKEIHSLREKIQTTPDRAF